MTSARPLKRGRVKLYGKQLEKHRIARKKKIARLAKRRQRAEKAEILQRQRHIDNLACVDLEKIKRNVRHDPERPGCWIWNGRFVASFSRVKPYLSSGQYGGMHADRATWLALGNDLARKEYLRTRCGHGDCVSPDHLYKTNQSQERALKALARGDLVLRAVPPEPEVPE